MLSVSNLLCNHIAGNEALRYGHTTSKVATAGAADACTDPGQSQVGEPNASGHRGASAAAAPGGMPAHRHRRRVAEENGVPKPVVVWGVTRACNQKCVHCYASANSKPSPDELTFKEGIALLDDLKSFDVPAVLFSGGEPLVRPETLDFISHARSIGLNCTLSTNGTLINDAMADRLAEVGMRYIGISLDGLRDRHDELRQMSGAFERSLKAIDRCRARGIRVGVRFTVHGLNQQDLGGLFELCQQHEVQRLCIYHLAYAGRGDDLKRVDLLAAQTRAIVEKIFNMTRQSHIDGHPLEVLTVGNHADAGYLLLQLEKTDPARAAEVHQLLVGTGGNRSGCNISSVDPVGNVHYDQFSWHYTCGNVRQKPFSAIWSEASDPRLAVLRNRASLLPAKCQSCRFLDVCNGNLRTRAESTTHDWLGMDPACYLSDDEIGQVAPNKPAVAMI